MKHILMATLLVSPLACSDSKDSDKNSAPETPAAVQTPEPAKTFEAAEISIDATKSGVWVYHGLKDGQLVPMAKEEGWIIGTSRYMWQTNSGSSVSTGSTVGGAYGLEKSDFDSITSCDSSLFKKDQIVSGFSASEEITYKWADVLKGATDPLDINFVIGRNGECIKLRVLTYSKTSKGLYTVKYQRIP